jgi:adenine-specific DNA-methyltransferase
MIHKIDRAALAATVRDLQGISSEDKTALLELINDQKKYGLVWENKPEDVEEHLREEIPVLREVTDRAIISNDPEAPNHILIEGDNLEALTTLSYTHEGKIDVIYIDPPYNTGNKDFIFNDKYVDKEDAYRHSKWISFIRKRIIIGKILLSFDGILLISIGPDELAQLLLICNEVFGESNQIAIIPRVQKKGNGKGIHFSPAIDYVLAYAKNIDSVGRFFAPNTSEFPHIEKNGPRAGEYYECTKSLYQSSLDSRPNQRYYIECPDGTFIIPPGNVFPNEIKDASFVRPLSNKDKCWRWSWDSYLSQKDLLVFKKVKKQSLVDEKGLPSNWNVYTKRYQTDAEEKGKVPPNYIDDCINSLGTSRLGELGLDFSFSKPCELIIKLLQYVNKRRNITILDYFAGSGTTLDATMQFNAEDGGHRQCILVTNNENNICEEVTYERNKRVINGYTTPKGETVEGLQNNNLRYYQIDFIDREQTEENKLKLMKASTALICIKENIYAEKETFFGLKLPKQAIRYFEEKDRRVLVIYNPEVIPYLVKKIVNNIVVSNPIQIYVLSEGQYPYTSDFEAVLDKVELHAMPHSLYQAYRQVLPAKKTAQDYEDLPEMSEIELNETEENIYKSEDYD